MLSWPHRAYLAQHGTPEKPHDLMQHDFLHVLGRNPNVQYRFGKDITVPLEFKLSFNSVHLLRDALLAGLGVGRIIDCVVQAAIAKGELVEVLSEFNIEPQPIYYYYPFTRHLKPGVRAFIDFYRPITQAELDIKGSSPVHIITQKSG